MITVFGEGRGFRVVWLLEEMGLAYRLRQVDLLAGVDKDPEFLAINPGGFIPAIQDGNVTMVESIAIMAYLMARYGPSRLHRTHTIPPSLLTSNSFIWVKPVSRSPPTTSRLPAILHPRQTG